jgi:hypothetical protein
VHLRFRKCYLKKKKRKEKRFRKCMLLLMHRNHKRMWLVMETKDITQVKAKPDVEGGWAGREAAGFLPRNQLLLGWVET